MLVKVGDKNKYCNIYTWDTETDPFEYGKEVQPFATCLYDGNTYYRTWGKRCIEDFITILRGLPHGYVYAHNGGRFDFFWLLPYVDYTKDLLIIKNRFVEMTLVTGHVVRDSYKILPFPLSSYSKDSVDYSLFTNDKRNDNKAMIVSYLDNDCKYLFELVSAYISTLDDSVTIGTTAYKRVSKTCDKNLLLPPEWDNEVRQFYSGGRVERKKTGVFTGNFYVCDINSSYPAAMRNFYHPLGVPRIAHRLDCNTYFACVTGKNYGAFSRVGDNGTSYDYEYGTYRVTIHELETAINNSMFKIDKVEYVLAFDDSIKFEDFVNEYYALRVAAKKHDNKIEYLLYKYLLNNAYGKFSVNPDNYKDWKLLPASYPIELRGDTDDDSKWELEMVLLTCNMHLYSRKQNDVKLKNIAIGASITGAARAMLLEGIARVGSYYYCDTDSLITENCGALALSDTELGKWKVECKGDRLAVGGKKMYALFDTNKCVKKASKGVRLTGEEIMAVAEGRTITYHQPAPVMGFSGTSFMKREIVAR